VKRAESPIRESQRLKDRPWGSAKDTQESRSSSYIPTPEAMLKDSQKRIRPGESSFGDLRDYVILLVHDAGQRQLESARSAAREESHLQLGRRESGSTIPEEGKAQDRGWYRSIETQRVTTSSSRWLRKRARAEGGNGTRTSLFLNRQRRETMHTAHD
jgi:hypothetical protein